MVSSLQAGSVPCLEALQRGSPRGFLQGLPHQALPTLEFQNPKCAGQWLNAGQEHLCSSCVSAEKGWPGLCLPAQPLPLPWTCAQGGLTWLLRGPLPRGQGLGSLVHTDTRSLSSLQSWEVEGPRDGRWSVPSHHGCSGHLLLGPRLGSNPGVWGHDPDLPREGCGAQKVG